MNEQTIDILKQKLRAATFHFLFTLFVAAVTGIATFVFLYPPPYGKIASGNEIWKLITLCELVLGPLMSLIIYQKDKSVGKLVFDYLAVGIIQIGALCWGLYTLSFSRPVGLIFSTDRFELVLPIDFTEKQLALPEVLSTWGEIKTFVALSPESDELRNQDTLDAIDKGIDIHMKPERYISIESEKAQQTVRKKLFELTLLCESAPSVEWCSEDLSTIRGAVVRNGFDFWVGIFDQETLALKDFVDTNAYGIDAYQLSLDSLETQAETKSKASAASSGVSP